MIWQAIAQIVDSYLTNSQRSREAASQTETNLNSNIGTGKNESQLGGGGTESYINQQTGMAENVHAFADAIGAGTNAADDNDADKQAKAADKQAKREERKQKWEEKKAAFKEKYGKTASALNEQSTAGQNLKRLKNVGHTDILGK